MVGHDLVGLALRKVLFTLTQVLQNAILNLYGVDQHKHRNKQGVNKEHDGLLLNHTVLMCKEIMVGNILHGQGHQSSGKEQAHSIFKCEGELFVGGVLMFFEMGELMQHPAHD
jgi:hypothetical protein